MQQRDVKSLRIGVLPPNGKVQVVAPLDFDLALIESIIHRRMNWIVRQIKNISQQERQTIREAVSGESYYFEGKKYRLFIKAGNNRGKLIFKNSSILELAISSSSSEIARMRVINNFYRKSLQSKLDLILPGIAEEIGVVIPTYSVRKMKNRWGSCNRTRNHININIDLIKKNPICLKYIVTHELVHLLEPKHNQNFRDLMDSHMKNWKYARELLNQAPLAHENWIY